MADVREWFGERLKRTNEAAWKAAHSRLYDHLRDKTHEGKTPTLADLAPLYQAVAHGCRAGRRQAALVEVYISRICRLNLDGTPEFYSSKKLGAVSSNLAAIGWFFDRPYEAPSEALVRPARSFVVSQASIALRGQGRLGEALQATRASLRMTVEARDWSNAAADASNLIQTELLFGDVMAAVSTATIGAAYADRSPNQDHQLFLRADNADAFHAAGEWERAAALFADAERRQRERSLTYPLLHALAGYQYCDLLLSMGRAADARARAARTLEWARPRKRFC